MSALGGMMVARRRSQGFSLLELTVAVTVIVLLMTALLTRLWFYQREIERLAAERVVQALRSALQLQLASMMARGRMNEVASLVEQNPMDWLAQRPSNYLGAFYVAVPSELEPGNWYFDKKEHKLVYLFSHSDNSESAEPNMLNFKVKLVNNRDNAVKQAAANANGADIFTGAVLLQVLH